MPDTEDTTDIQDTQDTQDTEDKQEEPEAPKAAEKPPAKPKADPKDAEPEEDAPDSVAAKKKAAAKANKLDKYAGDRAPVVKMTNIVKRFGVVSALEGVNFEVFPGEVVALLGDNGAGKSTLIKILTGVHTPTTGNIEFDGEPVKINSPRDARKLGIETVYQDLALVPLMSVSRNFFLGREIVYVPYLNILNLKAMNKNTESALLDIGIEKFSGSRSVTEPVGKLSGGERQSVAIGRAMHFSAKVLILDEPTSALSVGETNKVLEYTQRAKQAGLGVIFISHNISHVYQVADRYTIIRHGQKVNDYIKGELTESDIADIITGARES